MRKILIVVAGLLAIIAMTSMVNAKTLTYEDNGTSVVLEPSETLTIELDSHLNTGYTWIVKDLDTSILNKINRKVIPSTVSSDGKEKECIEFAGAAIGKTILMIELIRPWLLNVPLLDFSIIVESKGEYVDPIVRTTSSAVIPPQDYKTLGLPESFNWCDQGKCTSIKDQGSCGSCWSFATNAVSESAILISDDETRDLSEQYLVSCNDYGWGCSGGNWAFDYYIDTFISQENEAGVVYEDDFPYAAADLPCNGPHPHHEKLDSWDYVNGMVNIPSPAELKQAIYDHGPISVGVCANGFPSYAGGVYSYNCLTPNHAVVLTGWDDVQQCFNLRNSWGPWWGEQGYMRIAYGASVVGTAATYVEYGVGPTPVPPSQPIENGQVLTGLSANIGEWLRYYITVPEAGFNGVVQISGGVGDADLYVRYGNEPTETEWDCRPYTNGNNEICTISDVSVGVYYIGIHAYESFSDLSLAVSYDTTPEPDPDPEPDDDDGGDGGGGGPSCFIGNLLHS